MAFRCKVIEKMLKQQKMMILVGKIEKVVDVITFDFA
jgi:hypothetical protein